MTAPRANVSEAARLMGRQPINPVGQCFESAAFTFLADRGNCTPDERLCHGVGVSNFPGQEGHTIGHAWLEFDDPKHGRLAYDSTWGTHEPADRYRAALGVTHVVEYTRSEALMLWGKYDMPGPWDNRVVEAVNGSGKKTGAT